MIFSLSQELIDEIINAMDNQDERFVVNASEQKLESVSSSFVCDEQNFYNLPEWSPKNGFSMREEFVRKLHSPFARDELQSVLHSGRGVFKNFKTVLKKYPEIDKKWHIFKYNFMFMYINEWYNALREIWGLEALDQFPEIDEDLVQDDFSFKSYESEADKKNILLNIESFFLDEKKDFPEDLYTSLYKLWLYQFEKADSTGQVGYVCQTLSGEFAGCITASTLIDNQEDIMIVTSLFVPELLRGLGIGTELLSKCLTQIKSCEKKWILIPENLVSEFLHPLLNRMGFNKINSGYILEIR